MFFANREVRIGENCTQDRGQVFSNTDRPRLVDSICTFFLKLNEILSKRT